MASAGQVELDMTSRVHVTFTVTAWRQDRINLTASSALYACNTVLHVSAGAEDVKSRCNLLASTVKPEAQRVSIQEYHTLEIFSYSEHRDISAWYSAWM